LRTCLLAYCLMEDLSLHILDIVENSIAAGAGCVQITIREDLPADRLEIEIVDDGKGMAPEMIRKALDPFFTSKTVRRVGLGLPMFREAARRAGGELTIDSEPGRGTRVHAIFQHSHLDRQPLGDMEATLVTLIVGNPGVRLKYLHRRAGREVSLDTAELGAAEDWSALTVVERASLVRKRLKTLYH